MKRLAILAAAFGLSACAMTVPVVGSIEGGDALTGSATSFAGDPMGGTFEVRPRDSSFVCSGTYRYASAGGNFKGSAPLVCTNGKAGHVDFTSNGWTGSGAGRIDGRAFNVTF